MAETNSPAPGAGGYGSGSEGSTSATHRGGNGGSQESGFIGRVRERAAAQLETQKERATDGLGSAARAVRQSTQQLREQHHETVATYVEQAADQIERLAQRLREKDVRGLVDDAQGLARRQPALFVGSAFVVGLVGSRFLKSSAHDEHDAGEYGRPRGYGAPGSARALPSSRSDWRRPGAGELRGTTPGTTAFGTATEDASRGGSGTRGAGGISPERSAPSSTGGSASSPKGSSPKETSRSRRGGPETERF